MKPSLKLITALAACALAQAASADLLLTELQSKQSSGAPGTAEDFWELTNFGADAVDLEGYSWHDNGRSAATAATYALPAGTTIGSGESVIFTSADPTEFRTWWGIHSSVQVFQAAGSPGLGKGDGVSFFDAGGNELFFFSYAVGGFTLENGDPSLGENPLDPNDVTDPGHAGIAAGGTEPFQSLVWVPSSGSEPPRYTAATGSNFGTFSAAIGDDLGSPGSLGAAVDLSTYVRVGRHDLPVEGNTPLPAGTPEHNLLCSEASAVTYNWDTDTLFVTGDGGTSIVQVSKTGAFIDTMTLALGGSPQGTDFYDPEGLTYVGGGKFVMTEERDRQAVLFTYTADTTLGRADAQTVQLGTFVDNIGLEGVTFDPMTGDFLFVKELGPLGLFHTSIDFDTGVASNGSPTTENSVNLFDPALTAMSDFADIFALSNLTDFYSGNLLVLSQEDAQVINIDRSGNISSTLNIATDPGNPLSPAAQQHEGLTMDADGNLYIVNENGGGSIDVPQLWVYSPTIAPNEAPTDVVLNNVVNSIPENTPTATPVKVADIVVIDDGLGVNTLALSGPDAASFEINGTGLFIKAGVILDFEIQNSYSIVIEVDDITIGATPDATTPYTLTVTEAEDEGPLGPAVIITEVAPWSSGDSPVGADWIEVTNNTSAQIDLTGWKIDDSTATFALAATLNGVSIVDPGESVIFIETDDLAATSATFLSNWFGANPPSGLQIGSYSGSGLGLSSNGDGVNLFDASGVLQASVSFGTSPDAAPFATFDNSAGLEGMISQLSLVGVHGAFVADAGGEIGSPGTTGGIRITEVAPWSSGNSSLGEDWFEVTNFNARPVSINGWRMDDSSESPAATVPLHGVATLAPGESAIFIETSGLFDLAEKADLFRSIWFGANPPADLQIGGYYGSGVGLSTGGDAVNLYDTTSTRRASVSFGPSPTGPYGTFENPAGLDVVILADLSVPGINGAFQVTDGTNELIGSPGAVANYTLQLFHITDQEANAAAVEDAPRLSGILNALRARDLGNDGLPDNTLTLSSGDAIIPGLFFDASEAVYGTKGIADIQIQNELGIQAMALGNHEFDLGTAFLAGLIDGSAPGDILGADFAGTSFPYLSGNLNFTTDTNLAPLVTADHEAPQPNSLAATSVIDVNGEKIGIVAATTPTLATISSPGSVGITPQPFAGSPGPAELDALAAIIQADVNALLAAEPAIDKVILLAHMQSIGIEQALATRLADVDIIVAGGSNTRLFDADDRIRAGDTNQGTYPIILSDAEDKPVAVVSTDGSYKYLGRLVIDFDAAGNIIPSSYDETISGAYATDAQGLADLGAGPLIDPEIQQIANEIGAQIIATDGNWFGVTTEFLNGNRSGGGTDGVRSQETNLGNLTADANLFAAKAADPTVVMSLKNGGGIRASIGETVVLAGDTSPTRIAPSANPLSGRPEGGISENAIKGTLAFNNALSLLTLTKEEIFALLEHGVASSTNADNSAPGRFPQVAGVEVSYDLTAPAGSRVVSAAIVDGGANVIAPLVAGGNLVGDPNDEFRIVTLNFLANPNFDRSDEDGNNANDPFVSGGDGYPFPNVNSDPLIGETGDPAVIARVNRVDIQQVGVRTGAANFADDGTEQDALAEYLVATFPSPANPFSQADVGREFDTRLQNLAFRGDAVFEGEPLAFDLWLALNGYSSDDGLNGDTNSDGIADMVDFFFNRNPNAFNRSNLPVLTANNGDKLLRFTTLDGAAGVTGVLECSLDLGVIDPWKAAVEGVDYEVVSSASIDGETTFTYRLLGTAAAKFWRYDVTGS